MSGHGASPPDSPPDGSETAYNDPNSYRQETMTNLGSWEIEDNGRLPFILSYAELKLLGIAGVRVLFLRKSHGF